LFSNHAVAAAIMGAKKALAARPTKHAVRVLELSGSTAPGRPKLDVLATEIA
jgi:hypothetical protein